MQGCLRPECMARSIREGFASLGDTRCDGTEAQSCEQVTHASQTCWAG